MEQDRRWPFKCFKGGIEYLEQFLVMLVSKNTDLSNFLHEIRHWM